MKSISITYINTLTLVNKHIKITSVPYNTSLGRNTWKTLIGSQASLQLHCNQEGFNAMNTYSPLSKARIGIISNEQNDCSSCDSRIGFGTGGKPDSNTCGNEATFSPDNGEKHIKAIGYIMVQ